MTGFLATLTIVLAVLFAPPQSPAPQSAPLRPELIGLLDFESDHTGGVPKGWGGGPPGTFAVDDQVVHGGRWSLRIDRKADGPDGFTAVTRMLPIDFAGARLELSGFLRTENVAGFAGLWMRQEGDGGVVAFDNMESRRLNGTTGWTEYTIALPPAGAGSGPTTSVCSWTASRSRACHGSNQSARHWISTRSSTPARESS